MTNDDKDATVARIFAHFDEATGECIRHRWVPTDGILVCQFCKAEHSDWDVRTVW
ncbi:hypothetical protein [Changpingibacter yushuensis]|uniref:hypothetical protein n=1 Tax=Changpingibacter yushuensis TaxID=2758440 RepID=UPI0015F72E60|nr:hypothetical protein [Changpingibacter yushuensis]